MSGHIDSVYQHLGILALETEAKARLLGLPAGTGIAEETGADWGVLDALPHACCSLPLSDVSSLGWDEESGRFAMYEVEERIERINDELTRLLLRHMDGPALLATPIEGLYLSRREDATVPERCFEKPLAGLVVHGTKHSLMSGGEYVYGTNQTICSGVEMPIASFVDGASHEDPFLFLHIYLDREMLVSLTMEMGQASPEEEPWGAGVSIGEPNADIMECFLRLAELIDRPEQVRIRAPLILRELHYLLLLSPHGRLLRQVCSPGTQNGRAAKAIDWVRKNYRQSMRIEDLAHEACMSTASLHRSFKQLTGLSPIQYQKQLRLHEAKRLMLVEHERASDAAFAVGYESVTQFTREYKRLFGEPPLRDLNRMRT